MKTPQRMAMELQGFAVTTFLGTEEVQHRELPKSRHVYCHTYQPDFLDVGIPPLKDHKEELVGLFRSLIIEFDNRRLEDKKKRSLKHRLADSLISIM